MGVAKLAGAETGVPILTQGVQRKGEGSQAEGTPLTLPLQEHKQKIAEQVLGRVAGVEQARGVKVINCATVAFLPPFFYTLFQRS